MNFMFGLTFFFYFFRDYLKKKKKLTEKVKKFLTSQKRQIKNWCIRLCVERLIV